MLIDHIFSWGVYFMFPSYGSVVVWCSNVLRLRLLSFWFLDCTTFLLRHSCHLISRDEEYDRGKRKKVRKSMRDFSGPNPFQKTENTRSRQRRRLQAGQARSGHQPLRIWYCRSRSLLYPSFLQLGFLFLCFFYFLVCVIEELGQIRSMDLS